MKLKVETVLADLDLPDFSVGNDLVFLPDFQLSFNELFQNKVYSQEEIRYCQQFDQPMLRFASTWAAKEAVYKAVKQIRNQALAFRKIEICRDTIAGIPRVQLPASYEDLEISLSISHDGEYVFAIALVKLKQTPEHD